MTRTVHHAVGIIITVPLVPLTHRNLARTVIALGEVESAIGKLERFPISRIDARAPQIGC
jgi:hypothetical protein